MMPRNATTPPQADEAEITTNAETQGSDAPSAEDIASATGSPGDSEVIAERADRLVDAGDAKHAPAGKYRVLHDGVDAYAKGETADFDYLDERQIKRLLDAGAIERTEDA